MSTYSSLKVEEITVGDAGWGPTTTNNLLALEQAIVGMATLATSSFTANTAVLVLTNTNALQDARAICLNITATLTGAGTVEVPAIQKPYLVLNNSSGGFAVTVKVSGQTGVSVPNGKSIWVYNNGNDVVAAVTHLTSLTLASALPLASGGTGQTTQQAAINALTGAQTSGRYLRSDGTNASLTAIQAADVPTLNQNTTGTAAGLSATLAISSGGTGQTTATAALNALLPTQATQAGKALLTDGTNTSWGTVATSPGGSTTQIQFNDAGAFAGNSNFTFNKTTGVVTFGKDTTINGTSYGVGNYQGLGNVAIGVSALGANTGAAYQIAIGDYAMANSVMGAVSGFNIAIGHTAGYNVSTGTNNINIGKDAGNSNGTGGNNIVMGANAGYYFRRGTSDEASYNIFLGANAGNGQLIGGVTYSTGQYNTGIGAGSGYSLTTGYGNIMLGSGYGPLGSSAAGYLITSGTKNVVIGNYDGLNPANSSVGPDIRTASGHIVLADGEGTVRGYADNTSNWRFNKINNTAIVQRVVTIADGTSVAMNCDTTDLAIQANTQSAGTLTIAAPTGTPVDGQKIMLRLQSTNVQTFSFNSAFAGSLDLPLPTSSTGSSKYDYLGFVYNSVASKWQMVGKVFGF